MLKILIFIILSVSNIVLAENIETIAVCSVINESHVKLSMPYDKNSKSEFTTTKFNNPKEIYILKKILNTNGYNIYYENTDYPYLNWNAIDEGNEIIIMNEFYPIIKLLTPRILEQVYFFSIDPEGNGHLSRVSTRWYGIFGNNQGLTFAKCKGMVKLFK